MVIKILTLKHLHFCFVINKWRLIVNIELNGTILYSKKIWNKICKIVSKNDHALPCTYTYISKTVYIFI